MSDSDSNARARELLMSLDGYLDESACTPEIEADVAKVIAYEARVLEDKCPLGTDLLPDEHPLDKPLAAIHECALALEMSGAHDWAYKLASAYDDIQRYIVAKELADDTGVIPPKEAQS